MKKLVLKMDLRDERAKRKAMKAVSSISGVDSIAVDKEEQKLTVTGNVDPVDVVSKLRRLCRTEILTVGPAKEEKKQETTKDEETIAQLVKAYQDHNLPLPTYYYYYDYNPHSGCVIS